MANQGAVLNSSATSTAMITLKSADGMLFMVKEATAMEFGVVKLVLEDTTDSVIPLPMVASSVLGLVIRYCEQSRSIHSVLHSTLHSILPPPTLLHIFERVGESILVVENNKSIVELVKAADYLGIEVLLAFLMRSFKRRFGLGDDKNAQSVYTEDVEAQLLKEVALASEAAGFCFNV